MELLHVFYLESTEPEGFDFIDVEQILFFDDQIIHVHNDDNWAFRIASYIEEIV